MPARRCTPCGANWPDQKRFLECPECGAKTAWGQNVAPMGHSEMCHRLFDVHCAKLDADRDAQTKAFEAAFEATPSIPDPEEPDAKPVGE